MSYSIVSLALLSSVDFGTTVPPLTEFIKNLLGKYTEGQILKVSEEQYNLHTIIYRMGIITLKPSVRLYIVMCGNNHWIITPNLTRWLFHLCLLDDWGGDHWLP